MKTLLKWTFGIIGGLFIFGAVSSYLPSNTEVLTYTPEQAANDEAKPIDKKGVFDCLTNKGGVITPDEEHLYRLDRMTAYQSVDDGVLMRAAQSIEERLEAVEDLAFLITDRDFADGASLNGYLAAYRGTYEYRTTNGLDKKVLAFRLVNKTAPKK